MRTSRVWGPHGYEMLGNGKLWLHPRAKVAKKVIDQVSKELQKELNGFKGAIVEPKSYTVAVHYRMVKDANVVAKAKETFERVVTPWREAGDVRVTTGKMNLEVRPAEALGKGHALALLLADEKADVAKLVDKAGSLLSHPTNTLPFYIGDDETDEDGFRALRRSGVTARVGGPTIETSAEYWLASIAETKQFLELLTNAVAS